LHLEGNAAYALMMYDEPVANEASSLSITGGGARMDHLIEGNIGLAYYILDWFSVGVSDRVAVTLTNASSTGTGSSNLSYWKNLTLLTVTAYY
jgi:hypothetical protein